MDLERTQESVLWVFYAPNADWGPSSLSRPLPSRGGSGPGVRDFHANSHLSPSSPGIPAGYSLCDNLYYYMSTSDYIRQQIACQSRNRARNREMPDGEASCAARFGRFCACMPPRPAKMAGTYCFHPYSFIPASRSSMAGPRMPLSTIHTPCYDDVRICVK
jgi:hypothetical protein